ncbi:MAG: hypothetical protein AMXMBFR56_60040 [Polyangiaceae bacterium]
MRPFCWAVTAPLPSEPRVLAGKYALGRVLGAGGAGIVFEAENLLVGRRVAVKVLRAELAADPEQRSAFLAEARATARVDHPGVVEVLDLGLDRGGAPFIVMELLEGETLRDIVAARGPVPAPYACELLAQILAAVAAAHRAGIIHCDLKPSNVLVTHPAPDRPLVKVLDFGIAEGLVEHQWLGRTGTPLYRAPEQAQGIPPDQRTDVYSAAAILYELLSGTPPFTGESEAEILSAQLNGRLAPMNQLPSSLAGAIRAALSPDPNARPASAEELFERVAAHADPKRVAGLNPASLRSRAPIPLVARRAVAAIPPAPPMPALESLGEPDESWRPEPTRSWAATGLALVSGFSLGAALCWWLMF